MDSQFGIAHVWAQGDFVTKAVAVILNHPLGPQMGDLSQRRVSLVDVLRFVLWIKMARAFGCCSICGGIFPFRSGHLDFLK